METKFGICLQQILPTDMVDRMLQASQSCTVMTVQPPRKQAYCHFSNKAEDTMLLAEAHDSHR